MWNLNLAYTILVIAGSIPAWLWGGRDGRALCIIIAGGGALTAVSVRFLRHDFGMPAATVLSDALTAIAMLWVAMRTDRYWPLWIAAFHMLGILTFLSWEIAPGSAPRIFRALAGFWAIPMYIVLLLGPALDWRAGIRDERHPHRRDAAGD